MKPVWLTATLLTLVFTGPPAPGADLTKIDRAIRKEPAYQSKAPKFCLLVFGLEAKSRAWLVVDDDFLYVDHNCNGDLTEAGKRIMIQGEKLPLITEPNGTKHQIGLRRTKTGFGLSSKDYGGQYVGSTYRKDLLFADRPQDAPIVHFNGPLTFQILEGPKTWAPGENANFIILFGTPGLGAETFAYMIHSFKFRPTADFEFPANNSGDPPATMKLALKEGSKDKFTGG